MAKPIIKSAGSKSRLVPELLARLPVTWNRYFEPFVGGGALFFAIAPERAVLGDLNPDLVNVYRAVVADLPPMIRRLRAHARAYASDAAHAYYGMRERWNRDRAAWSTPDAAAAFVFLNKTMWNGLWRVNRAGLLNTPMGRYTNPAICEPERLQAAQTLLASADLRTGDFRDTVREAGPGDLVYCDPPYDPLSPTASFTAFTRHPFGRDQQRELAATARKLVARGCHVIVSNADTPFVRSLYADFRIDEVKCRRAINSDASKRGAIDELIIIGTPRKRRASTG